MISYRLIFTFIILSSGILFFSCDPNKIYEENIEIKNAVWNKNDKIIFNVEITDTICPHNILINKRITGMYPKSNLYLFICTKFPKGELTKDTLLCFLADEKGKWYGKGFGDIWSITTIYKQNVRFPQKGKYTFEIEQAMRIENLPQILDIGLRIEKSKI
ncbi:MAG: gliding motility lipoprotein GldH [Bacteroidales bacterium]|nr:gliding motility lipoprotein GldH [Bacteroidales bacterium]